MKIKTLHVMCCFAISAVQNYTTIAYTPLYYYKEFIEI